MMNEQRKRLLAEKRRAWAFKKHPRWAELMSVVGYVDSNGAVHAVFQFNGDMTIMHSGVFDRPRYKTWRWTKSNGLEQSMICLTTLEKEDWHAVQNWLYKNGCLNNWEL